MKESHSRSLIGLKVSVFSPCTGSPKLVPFNL